MPLWPAFSWGLSFLCYYGILLCSGGLYSITAQLSMSYLIKAPPSYMVNMIYILAALQQLAFSVVFIMDVFGPRLMEVKDWVAKCLNNLLWQWNIGLFRKFETNVGSFPSRVAILIKEHISFIRNLIHFLLTPVVLLGYSLVEFYALHEVAFRGKEVCKHGASAKNNLIKALMMGTVLPYNISPKNDALSV